MAQTQQDAEPSVPRALRNRDVRVGRTRVGKGVFAGKWYRSDMVVGEIVGDWIDDPDYRSDYCFNLEDGCVLEPHAPFRFVNHSCDPNCFFDFVDESKRVAVNSKRRIFLFAAREIRAGDELTIDYNWSAEAAIPCRCQASTCRGWIVRAELLKTIGSDQPDLNSTA